MQRKSPSNIGTTTAACVDTGVDSRTSDNSTCSSSASTCDDNTVVSTTKVTTNTDTSKSANQTNTTTTTTFLKDEELRATEQTKQLSRKENDQQDKRKKEKKEEKKDESKPIPLVSLTIPQTIELMKKLFPVIEWTQVIEEEGINGIILNEITSINDIQEMKLDSKLRNIQMRALLNALNRLRIEGVLL